MAASGTADLVIRGGTIVDGTGRPSYVGDVAVTGKEITAIGPSLSTEGRREYDARGLIVAPGWVDAHTHFDGQVTWDPYLTPSAAGGVTTCIMGNCGVGFAPCQVERRDDLINLVEAIEDVPGTAVHEGLRWEWETFEEYLDALSRRELACDVAVMIGHSAVRNWVLGANMSVSDQPAGSKGAPVTPEQIKAMAAVVRDAVAAGAIGFSTSRAVYHRDMKGVLMPGSLASSEEMLALLRAIGQGGGGVFGANLDFSTYDDVPGHMFDQGKARDHLEAEWSWLDTIAGESAGKISMTFEATEHHPERFRRVEDLVRRHEGLLIRTQIHVRPQGFLQSVHSRLNLLLLSRSFQELARPLHQITQVETQEYNKRVGELLAQLREPGIRAKVVAEAEERLAKVAKALKQRGTDRYMGLVTTLCPFSLIFAWTPGCEPEPGSSVRAIANREGRKAIEVYYDLLVPRDGSEFGIAWRPLACYSQMNLEPTRGILENPYTIPGVSDAGAHSGIFNDANGPTHLLTHWVRDRSRGPRLALELVVAKQARETARVFGLVDRGQLLPGKRADINVIDLEALQMHRPFIANDLPTGATRWMQRVSGYRLTLVAGRETFEDGRPTGALPGRLVRNPKADATAWRGEAARFAWRPGAGNAAATLDLSEHALKAAEGGGASAIARIARELEKDKDAAGNARSRL